MFRRFFAALAALTANAESLAASFAEANARFRSNLALDHIDEPPTALEHVPAQPTQPAESAEAEPTPQRNGRTRHKTHA